MSLSLYLQFARDPPFSLRLEMQLYISIARTCLPQGNGHGIEKPGLPHQRRGPERVRLGLKDPRDTARAMSGISDSRRAKLYKAGTCAAAIHCVTGCDPSESMPLISCMKKLLKRV